MKGRYLVDITSVVFFIFCNLATKFNAINVSYVTWIVIVDQNHQMSGNGKLLCLATRTTHRKCVG